MKMKELTRPYFANVRINMVDAYCELEYFQLSISTREQNRSRKLSSRWKQLDPKILDKEND